VSSNRFFDSIEPYQTDTTLIIDEDFKKVLAEKKISEEQFKELCANTKHSVEDIKNLIRASHLPEEREVIEVDQKTDMIYYRY